MKNEDYSTSDYNAKLAQDYVDIRAKVRGGVLPLVARIPEIDKAVSDYVLAQDDDFERKKAKAVAEGRKETSVPIQYRDSVMLERMADLLDYEYLTWSHHDKMNIVENPILSDSQMRTRHHREMRLSDVYTGVGDETIGRYRDHTTGEKRRIYDYMTPERDMSLIPTAYLDLYDALDNAGLTDRQRQTIDLIYFEGMTQEDAAEEMGVSRATLRTNESRAFDKIRKYKDI